MTMAHSSNKSDNGNQPTPPQIAVQLCALANATTGSTNPADEISSYSYLSGWNIVWNGQQTTDANYAFIATDQDTYVLAIRGSLVDKNLIDWDDFANWILEDFDVATQVPWKYATTANAKISNGANIGFTNLFNMTELRSNLSAKDYLINNAVKNGKKVIITGHSLGGNIANVYTSYFITTVPQEYLSSGKLSLYTFAAPAPGNGHFAKDLDARLQNAWHYQSNQDAIPNFPVASDIRKLVAWYSPAPEASATSFTNKKGQVIQLVDAINTLANLLILTDILSLSNYKQQTNNYTKFDNALNQNNQTNPLLVQWFDQALYQHQIFNYANFLKAPLPKPASQFA
jgi:lipase (class 3)